MKVVLLFVAASLIVLFVIDRLERGKGVSVKVSRETFRMVRWLLIGALAAQLLIVPWRWGGAPTSFTKLWGLPDYHATVVYRPIVSPPLRRDATIDVGRLLVQLAVTGGLLLLWLRVAKPEE